jgi:hypothetical protein
VVEWNHVTFPKEEEIQECAPNWKIAFTISWDGKGVIIVNFLPQVTTVNSFCHTETIRSLNACLDSVRPAREMSEDHTKVCKQQETIANFG